MRRTLCCLILITASPLAFGQNPISPSGKVGDCRDSVITLPSPAPVKAPLATSSVHKAPVANTATPTSGGGGGNDDATPPRVPRWHSFLPGMFR